MNKDYVRKDINTSDIVEGTDDDMNQPVVTVVTTEPVAERVLVDETMVHEGQLGETIAEETKVSKSIPDKAPIGESFPHEAPIGANAGSSVALLTPEDSQRFRTIWNEVQGKFVDEPRAAVQQADALVSEVIAQLTQVFANEHSLLDGQWKQGEDVSTEDLRQALLRYHSFFNRLVV